MVSRLRVLALIAAGALIAPAGGLLAQSRPDGASTASRGDARADCAPSARGVTGAMGGSATNPADCAAARDARPGTEGLSPSGGSEHRGAAVLGVTADQVLATQLEGARVANGSGDDLGRIEAVVLNARTASVDLLGIRAAHSSGDRLATVPWSSLQASAAASDGYVTKLGPDDLAAAPDLKGEIRDQPDLADVAHDLVGRPVVSRDNQPAGKLQDLVIGRGDGRIVYLLVDTGHGALAGLQKMPQALPWSAVAALPARGSKPIAVNLDAQQVAEAPRFGLKAGTRPEQPSAQSTFDLLSPPADRPMSNEGSSGKNGGTGGAWSGKLGGSER